MYQKDKNQNINNKLQAKMMKILLLIWQYILNYSQTINNKQIHNSNISKKNSNPNIKSTFNVSELVTKYDKIDPIDLADFWKSTLWLILFSFISIFQGYIGIKIVFFNNINAYNYIHFLFGFNIFLCHFEIHFIRKYIDDYTEADNKYFDSNIHDHPVFYRSVPGNWCDLCWKRIDKMCYRCDKCDYDICTKCWSKEKKTNILKKKDNKRGDVTTYEYFNRLFQLHSQHYIVLSCALILVFLSSLVSIRLPSLRGNLFDYIFDINLNNFYDGLKIYILLNIIQALLNAFHNILIQRVREQIMNHVQQLLYERILKQDMEYFDSSTSNLLAERLEYGLSDTLSPFLDMTKDLISNSIGLFGSFIFCYKYSYKLLLLALSTLGPMTYITILFNRWHRSSMRAVWYFNNDMWVFATESFKNIRTIRSYSREPSILQHYNNMRNELHNKKMKGALMTAINNTLRSWFNLASSTLIVWAGGVLVFNDHNNINSKNILTNGLLTVGGLITFERYWNKFKGSIFGLQRLLTRFEKACFMAKHIFRLLDSDPNIEYIDNKNVNKKRIKITDLDGDIVFKNVHYTYITEPNKKVLKGINLTIPKGKTTAFVGRSGGGKTTLINLILRFYDATSGSISINNINICDIDVYSWRNQIALVSQTTELFANTIVHNIAFGVDNYTMNDAKSCAKLSNSHDFIIKFDDKYMCKIGENGTKLSGGQKQRLSIARMLMKKPKLMLLDEATSSLDAESEALVQAALDIAIKDQQSTVILVAHRLSTVINADQIIVIDDGKVIESGTHLELVEKDGLYAKLVDRQLNLQNKMKQKAKNIKKEDEKSDTIKDTDNIDKLIEQIQKVHQINIGTKS